MKHLFLLERAYWYLCSMLIWEDLVKTWEGEFVPFGLNEREPTRPFATELGYLAV